MDFVYDNFQNHQTVKHTYQHPVRNAEIKNMGYYSTLQTFRHPVNAVDQEIMDYLSGILTRMSKSQTDMQKSSAPPYGQHLSERSSTKEE